MGWCGVSSIGVGVCMKRAERDLFIPHKDNSFPSLKASFLNSEREEIEYWSICTARAQLLVLCKKQSKACLPDLFWRHQPVCYPCQICNTHAKRHLTSKLHMWRLCIKIHYDRKHSILKKPIFFLFFLLLVVLNDRHFFPIGSKGSYLSIWRWMEN